MKIRVKDIQAVFIIFITLFSFFCITFLATLGKFGIIFSGIAFIGLCLFVFNRISSNVEQSSILTIPVLLSVFQNVYLGFFSPRLSSTVIQMLTVLNFLLAGMIFVLLLIQRKKHNEINTICIMFYLLILYSFFSVIFLKHINILSIIASLRNIVSIFLFFLIGYFASDKIDFRKFETIVLFLGLVVLVVGFYDVMSDGTMWKSLNITDLWTKKGIRVQSSGLPTNFYSSEKFNGQRIRRMASTFADPVNLGSFLFAVFCIAWHKKKKILELLLIIGMIFTVSKGAWMGLLIFICVYAYYYLPKSVFIVTMITSSMIGLLFLLYAFRTSANSVFLHISGLLAAFKQLIRNPFGSGIGSNGVLAKQFSGLSANSDITETGLGMIISQLGMVGFLIYVIYFVKLTKMCNKIPNKRDAVLCCSLLFSVILNIFFNEVALSPNTCATYFMVVGIIISSMHRKEIQK